MELTNTAASSRLGVDLAAVSVTLSAWNNSSKLREGEARLHGHRRDRSRRRPARARARERAARRADRPGRGRRAAQEHRLAAGQRARAPRAGRAGRRARTAAAGTGDPARGRAQHARAPPGRAGPAVARRAVGGQRRDDQPGRARPRRGRARGAGGQPSLPRASASGSGTRSTTTARPTARCSWPSGALRSRKRQLHRYTARTIVETDLLRGELESVRARSLPPPTDELETGLSAMAAPVRGARGEVIAALSISGPNAADDACADPRAATDSDQRGADAQPPPRPPRARRTRCMTGRCGDGH